jgi:hypothetical protein
MQRHAFRHYANLPLQIECGGGPKGLAQNLDGSCGLGSSRPVSILMVVDLPAPFGPEKAEELSGGHTEGDILDRSQCAEAPRESMGLNRCIFHVRQG